YPASPRSACLGGSVRRTSLTGRQGSRAPGGTIRHEVRVEDLHLRYAVDRNPVRRRGLADRLGRRGDVDAERLAPVLGHIRADPRDTLLGVAIDDRQPDLGL